jgi:hypothetical protein
MNRPAVNARDLVLDPVSLIAIALFAAVLGGIGWFSFGACSPSPSTNKKLTHMHCPACHEEIPYNPKLAGKKCTNCSEGAVYKATVGSIFDENRDNDDGSGRVILFVLAFVVGLQGLVFAGMWRLRFLRRRADEARNRLALARCPFCNRGVRYSITKAGAWTTCYQCKTAFALPAEGIADIIA